MNKEELIRKLENIRDNFADNILIDLLNDTIDYIKILQYQTEHLQQQLEQLEKVSDTRMIALLDIEHYCDDRISYCKENQSEDEWDCCIEELTGVLRIIDKLKGDSNE